MALCKLCNKNESFLKSGTPVTGIGHICETCRGHYTEIIKAINAGDREKFDQLKRGFLERTQTTENLSTVDVLLKNLDLKYEEAQKKRAADALEKAEREIRAEKERKEKEIQAEKEREEKERREREAARRRALIDNMPVVTTDTIEGYRINGKGTLLSITVAANMRLPISNSARIEDAKERAIKELRTQAANLDLNAIVGLRMDLIRTDDGQWFNYLVSAYATGVYIVD